MAPDGTPHPIRLVVADDLRRSRLTVFFRLLLALPHLVWLTVWTVAALLAAVASWVATLLRGQSPAVLHRFLAAYVRYSTQLFAYLFLAANPYPAFDGAGGYPVDVELDPPARQSRWKTGFRMPLALPALFLLAVLTGGPGGGGSSGDEAWLYASAGGVAWAVAFLAWFACLARGRMPRGFRNLLAYVLRFSAQVSGYLFLLTDRYPEAGPTLPAAAGQPPEHRVGLIVEDDGRRSRLTVLFRALIAVPHVVWLALWSVAALAAAVLSWLLTLVLGRTPSPLHRFLAAFLRYAIHVSAFFWLVANPFPGFVGREGRYPVDARIDPPAAQRRLVTAFRLPLALPALLVAGTLGVALAVVGLLAWFAALATGRMPRPLRELGAFILGYTAQVDAYVLLLTDRYPYSGPPAERLPEPEQPLAAAAA